MPVPRVRIVTDSVADVPPEVAARLNIAVLPIYLLLGNQSYRDDATLDRTWFYAQLRARAGQLKTAAPPPQVFGELFASLVAAGAEEIIGLFIAESLSSIVANARLAAAQTSGACVTIVDTAQVTLGQGWLAILAAEAAAQGASGAEIVEYVTQLRPRAGVLGMLDALDHLQHSGRVPWTTIRVGELLKIKPLIRFYDGEATLVRRVRTHARALDALEQGLHALAPFERLALIHSRADAAVLAEFAARLVPLSPQTPLPIVEVSPVFGAHIGPGGLGVAFVQAPEHTLPIGSYHG